MTTVITEVDVDDDGLASYLAPRDDVVVDASVEEGGPIDGPARYEMVTGPFASYERTVSVTSDGAGRHRVTQTVDYRLGIGLWNVVFHFPYRSWLRGPTRHVPWWAPPQVLDRQAAASLASLAYLSVIAGYLGTLITQTLTYAAEEFGAGERAQGDTLAAVRVGVIVALGIAAWADRHGRRRALLFCAGAGCVLAATGALAPGLIALGGSQVVARGLSTALGLLILVVAAEEMPAGSRAYAASLLTMTAALGAGMVLWFLPIVDIDDRAWRVLYLLPLLFLPLVRWTAPRLPESRRFVRRHADAHFAGHGKRLALLAGSTLLIAMFTSPASQLQNEFLRDEYDFSATRVALFTVLTVTPASIGIVVGGRLADTRGKRLIGGIGTAAGAILAAGQFLAGTEALMWLASTVGSIAGGLAVPALAIYGPELFPTSLRTKANVIMTTTGVMGSAVGLVVAGRLGERWSLGPAIAVLAVFPVLVAALLIPFYPETANRELEELNPEDDLGALGGSGLSPVGPTSL